MAAESVAGKEHLLTLKVMRLTKPGFSSARGSVTGAEGGLNVDNNSSEKETSSYSSELLPGCPSTISGMLVLPQNFENIYLGETFTCYICVHNDSNLVAADVVIKVDLQTSSQRISLPCQWSEKQQSTLKPEQMQGQVISHEVKEIGQHILVCAVTYTNSTSAEQLYFRKFFKFSVAKPLDVKTKFYNAESNDVYLEAQIQNTTHLPMFMERVSLEPSEQYHCFPLNSGGTNSDEASIFSSLPYLAPHASRQYLYQLKPKPEVAYSLRGVTAIGRLEMIWRTTMGERGRLQTSQLQRVVPGYGDLRMIIQEVPSVVKIRQPFQIVCTLYNSCERTLDLTLVLDDSCLHGLLWTGTSNKALGTIPANGMITLPLCLVPTAPGLQNISGVRLTDSCLGRTYEHDEIAQVFVYI